MFNLKRNEQPQAITPKGVAIWPSLNEPDFKFKEEYGEYHARIRIKPDAQGMDEFTQQVEDLLEKAYDFKVEELKSEKKAALAKRLGKISPIKVEEDQDTGEETGYLVIRASMNAGGVRKKDGKRWSQKPDIFSATGKKLKSPPKIGGGSEMKLGIRMRPYYFPKDKEVGVSFELEAVQLITLQEVGGNRTAEDYGFGVEDGDDIEDRDYGFSEEEGDDIRDEDDGGEPGDF